MEFSVERLRVAITTRGCEVPADERSHLQPSFAELAESVQDFPEATLMGHVVYHPGSERYHVDWKLSLPGRTLFMSDEDPYLDAALQQSLEKLTRRAQAYSEHPDQEAVAEAERRAALDNDIVAPEDPAAGPLAEAAEQGDYRTFRSALSPYEDWLRNRVGRLVQRRPEVEARIGRSLRIGDIVEEVYLNAFETFTQRTTDVRLGQWLEGLIEPSIQALMQHPDEEREAVSLARTVREGPL